MHNGPGLTIMLAAAAALSACARDETDQNIAIDNQAAAPADIEALPADESSATSSGDLANGATDDTTAAENATANNSL